MVKVAVCQMAAYQYDLAKTLAKVEAHLHDAAKENVAIIVFPEACIGGYPKHSTFATEVGVRKPEGRGTFLKYHNAAISVPSETTEALAKMAKQHRMSIIIGVIEKERGTLFCTALYIDREFGLVGKHRKLMPTGAERLIWGQGDETTIDAHDLSLHGGTVKASATICWENYMPLFRFHTYSQGVSLYCAPTVDARETWIPTMRHIAQEGRCFVLSACAFATKDDFPADDDAQLAPEDIVIAGGSCIVSPLGELLAGPLRGSSGVLTAEIDLDDCIRGRYDMNVTGHYSRSDLFKLQVRGH
jgi:beta-cyano-L-alanine hydratase/nitrilase